MLYYQAVAETKENLKILRLLDERFLNYPAEGVLPIQHYLRCEGYQVNHKRVRHLLRKMGIMAIFPKPDLSKLLDNALKYSNEKPVIMISITKAPPYMMIEISDNGIGIEDSYQQKVFERFFCVPTGNIHTVKGYGLGLSYARSIVEKHKGFLLLESRKNQGTRLIINYP